MDPPLHGPNSVYDPLRRENLGRSVLGALTDRSPVRLDQIPRFNGCGIYALYYAGDHELYAPISSSLSVPIYVGKSDPVGGRTGVETQEAWEGTPLLERLGNHRRKIMSVNDLAIEHFYARYLTADDLFTPMAERLMIRDLRPVWNVALDGFGVNQQGGPREAKQMRAKWHEVHTGAKWADKMTPRPEGPEPHREAVRQHLKIYGESRRNPTGRPTA
ncbi:Eco29kI family restriction endonuclease [Streptomyces syringium]|uniref:Eco29kI family restriction endonuclease n=1 Tax=Streptomyces syringium TaxID=76729 RepID=UPI003D8D88B9